ncbi:MAG: sodium:alanine symporter family protein [Tissierellia bacterium]|nr:sodium:alanine symporter family protein [Tissierellia bacterium]
MGGLLGLVQGINKVLWGPPMMIVLVGFGIISTVYLGFPQFRRLGLGFKESFGKIFSKDANKEGSMSSFQSLATAVAAQVGTGNIGGVATAIVSGGPGAIFWMWIVAILGMSTISVEALLAQKYRETKDGDLVGGPAYYLSKGLREKNLAGLGSALAGFFAVMIIIALGFVGNMVQSNSIASVMESAFGINPLVIGIVLAIFAALIFIGGMGRIAKFAELVVPIMALVYVIGSIALLIRFSDMIGPVISAIFKGAFTGEAVLGGLAGVAVKNAIRYGVARGLFSNEAGMGSTPNSHAVADVAHPVIQGTVAMVGVFIDTIIVCTATALIVLVSGANVTAIEQGLNGPVVTQMAFQSAFGDLGGKFLAIALMFFAFTTVVGWYYFGESNIKYLFHSKTAIRIYQVIVLIFVVLGSTMHVELVWELADMFNAIMVIPNVIGLLILLNGAKELYGDYDEQVRSGKALHYHYKYQ